MGATRIEQDSMGEVRVPAGAYFGAQTQRASLNFQISPLRLPRAFLRALGLIKGMAARVNLELGLIPAGPAAAVIRAAQAVEAGLHDDQFIVDVFQTGSGTSTNMNANEVIAGIANEELTGVRGGRSPVHPNDMVNLGQSSNDVIPTAIHLSALLELRDRLLPAFSKLKDALAERASAFDHVVKLGRTHLQDAVPIRLGQEFSGYASQVEHSIERARRCFESLSELPIGGTAVGTGLNTHDEFAERVIRLLGQETGLSLRTAPNCFESMAQRDAAVETSGQLKTIAVSLSCIANNIRFLASGPRCGIGEIRIPALQPGSSIMPGKVNPVIPEAVMMVAAQVVGNDATVTWANALGSNFDLNVMMPVIAYNLLQSVELLSSAAEHLAAKCVDASTYLQGHGVASGLRIEADEARCRELIERSLAMATSLAPRIGYDNAAALAKAAYDQGKTIRELALELAELEPDRMVERLGPRFSISLLESHGGFPKRDEIEKLLDPRGQTERGSDGTGGAVG